MVLLGLVAGFNETDFCGRQETIIATYDLIASRSHCEYKKDFRNAGIHRNIKCDRDESAL